MKDDKTREQIVSELEGLREQYSLLKDSLQKSEYLYSSFVENCAVGIWHIDLNGYTVFLNPAMCAMLEIEKSGDISGMTYHSFFTPESLITMDMEHNKRPKGIASSYEVEIVGKHGKRSNVLLSGVPLFGADGALESLIGTFTDITERKRIEYALQESEQRYRTLAEAANDIIFIIDREDLVRYLNKCGAEFLGCEPDEVIGRPRNEFFPPDISAHMKSNLNTVFETGESLYAENEIPSLQGMIWLGTILVPLRDKTGKIDAIMGISRNTTEQK